MILRRPRPRCGPALSCEMVGMDGPDHEDRGRSDNAVPLSAAETVLYGVKATGIAGCNRGLLIGRQIIDQGAGHVDPVGQASAQIDHWPITAPNNTRGGKGVQDMIDPWPQRGDRGRSRRAI